MGEGSLPHPSSPTRNAPPSPPLNFSNYLCNKFTSATFTSLNDR